MCNYVYSMTRFIHLKDKNKRKSFTRSYFWKITLPEYEKASFKIV